MTVEDYKVILASIPDAPGVYRFIDKDDIVIYVGKAKNIKKRVTSYFNKSQQYRKTEVMVKTAVRLEFTVVNNETDALLLENSLIKKFQPRYNIHLKDDKTYPYICIKKENFPRVFFTRKFIRDGSEYFGCYTSVDKVRSILEFIKVLFPLRNCSLNLSRENINKKKYKVCLEYHLGNCKGPCVDLQSEQDYNNSIQQIRNVLKGQTAPVSQYLKDKMNNAAENYHFEIAEQYKKRLDNLELYKNKTTIVHPKIDNVDVFAYHDSENEVYVCYLKIANGTIIQTKIYEAVKKIDEEKEDLLSYVIENIREEMHSNSNEIIVPFELPYFNESITITVPQIGDKQKLLDLANKNIFYYKKSKTILRNGSMPPWQRILKTLQEDFRLSELPIHIECFDNSNFQGSFPVASMVCFKNGRPSKKDYRHFNIKTVIGPDDFASMEEIVYRRYKRLLDENVSLPKLIIIDGGKGQLSAALASLKKLNLEGKIAICGIAKRLEEIYFPNDSVPLYVNKKSESLKLIQQIRDEAHRFAITFHRSQRQKGTIKSSLTSIDGVGNAAFEKLIKEFRSIKKLQSATAAEIIKVVGESKADLIINYFNSLENKEAPSSDEASA